MDMVKITFQSKYELDCNPIKVSLNEIGWFSYAIGFKNIVWQDGYLIAFISSSDSTVIEDKDKQHATKVFFTTVGAILYTKSEYKRYLFYDPLHNEVKLLDKLPDIYNEGKPYIPIFPYPTTLLSKVLNRIKTQELVEAIK